MGLSGPDIFSTLHNKQSINEAFLVLCIQVLERRGGHLDT